AHVGGEPELVEELVNLAAVVALVQADAAVELGVVEQPDRDRVDRGAQQLLVTDVGAGNLEPDRDASAFTEQAALDPAFGSAGRMGTASFAAEGGIWPSGHGQPATPSRSPFAGRRRAAPAARTRQRRRRPPIRGSACTPTSSYRCRSHRARSTGNPCAARTGSRSSRPGRAHAGYGNQADARAAAATAAPSPPKRCPESVVRDPPTVVADHNHRRPPSSDDE